MAWVVSPTTPPTPRPNARLVIAGYSSNALGGMRFKSDWHLAFPPIVVLVRVDKVGAAGSGNTLGRNPNASVGSDDSSIDIRLESDRGKWQGSSSLQGSAFGLCFACWFANSSSIFAFPFVFVAGEVGAQLARRAVGANFKGKPIVLRTPGRVRL